MSITEKFAKRIREVREAEELTQTQLVTALGFSRGAISYYENGDRTPDIEFLDRFAKRFDLSLEYALGLTDNVKGRYAGPREGAMQIKFKLDEGAYKPEKAHEADAGFDIRTPERVVVRAGDSATIDTGVHIQIPRGYVGFLKSKSGLNVKFGIQSEGVIDAGYTGSIVAKLYNHGHVHHIFEVGDKITQIVLLPILEVELVEADELEETERGDQSFGSSGR